jgi:curved DNA-binding protein CbpA
MNKLQKAFVTLGLVPGESRKVVEARYKRLVKAWHPDRVEGQDTMIFTREMQHINDSRDMIKAHFDSGSHNEAGGCECRFPDPDELVRQLDEARRRGEDQRKTSTAARPNFTAEPVCRSDFYTAPYPFSEISNENATLFRQNGYFHIEVERPQWATWLRTDFQTADFEISAECQFVHAGPDSAAGLIFRLSELGFYTLFISPTGFYSLFAYLSSPNEKWETILETRFSEAIRPGNQQNFLKVRMVGELMDLSANGVLLSRVIDRGFRTGSTGIFLQNDKQGRTEARFIDFRVEAVLRTQDYHSDFYASPSDFPEIATPEYRIFKSEGYQHILVQTPQTPMTVYQTLGRDLRKGELSVEVQFVGTPGQQDKMGLLFGYSSSGFYTFAISPQGFYTVQAFASDGPPNGKWTTIAGPQFSEAIRQSDLVNCMKVRITGRQVLLSVNGATLPTIGHSFALGKTGIFVFSGLGRQRVEARFRNFRIYSLLQ